MIDKGVCNKGFIWNPSSFVCECDKPCDISEYFDYSNCKCRKNLFDKLTEKCTENINEVEISSKMSIKMNAVLTHYALCYLQ